MRRFFFFLSLAVPLLLSCGNDEKTADEIAREAFVADSAALKVAVTPTLDCLPLFVAEEEGLFQQCGLNVRLRLFQAQMDQDTAMVRGRVEAMTTDLVRAAYMQQQGGLRLRYVAATPLYWQLVSNASARIKQLSQMEDKMMAMTRYSATAMLSVLAIDSAGLNPDHVFRIQVNDVGVRLNMLQTGIMDALWLPEPQASVARMEGNPVVDDSRLRDLQLGVIAFNEQALADTTRQQQLERFIEAYNMACDTIGSKGLHHYRHLISRQCGVKEDKLDSLPDDMLFPHAAEPRLTDVQRAGAWLNNNH